MNLNKEIDMKRLLLDLQRTQLEQEEKLRELSILSSDCEAYFIKTSIKRKKLLDLLGLLSVGNKNLSEKPSQSQRSQELNQVETIQQMMEEDLRLQDLIFRSLKKVLSI